MITCDVEDIHLYTFVLAEIEPLSREMCGQLIRATILLHLRGYCRDVATLRHAHQRFEEGERVVAIFEDYIVSLHLKAAQASGNRNVKPYYARLSMDLQLLCAM